MTETANELRSRITEAVQAIPDVDVLYPVPPAPPPGVHQGPPSDQDPIVAMTTDPGGRLCVQVRVGVATASGAGRTANVVGAAITRVIQGSADRLIRIDVQVARLC